MNTDKPNERSSKRFWIGCCSIIAFIFLLIGGALFYGAYKVVDAFAPSEKLYALNTNISGENSLLALAWDETVPSLKHDSLVLILSDELLKDTLTTVYKDHGSIYSGIGFQVHLIQKSAKEESDNHDFYLLTISDSGERIDEIVFASYVSRFETYCGASLYEDLQVVRRCKNFKQSLAYNLLQNGIFEIDEDYTRNLNDGPPKLKIRKIGG